MPSLLALLGLVAVAGYQNRDKIGAALGGLQRDAADPNTKVGGMVSGLDGLLANGTGRPPGDISNILSGLGGAGLSGALGDLLNTFKGAGKQDVADSWLNPAVPTQSLTPAQVEQAIGEETVVELTQRTGLSREDLLNRLATAIPSTVDKLTPGGEMPTEEAMRAHLIRG
ncbi:MAG: YidB family protein [Devosia sp.]